MNRAYRLLAGLLMSLALFLGGYVLGRSHERTADEARKGEALEVAVEKHDEVAAVGQAIERETVQRAVKTEAIFNGIQQKVRDHEKTHAGAADCSLDDDGLRLWRAANANTDPDATGERDAGMPGAAAAAERQDGGSAGEPRRGGEGVPPVPGSASGPGAVAGEN